MKTSALLAVALGLCAWSVCADEKPAQLDVTTQKKSYLDWDDPAWWQREWKRGDETKFTIGKSEFGIKGPLFETFRFPRRTWSDLSLGEKIVNLPIVSWFVPQPMTAGSSRGERGYFNWGEKDLPWSTVAEGGKAGPGSLLTINY